MSESPDSQQHDILWRSSDRSLPSFTPIRNASQGSNEGRSGASGSWRSHNSEQGDWQGEGAERPSPEITDGGKSHDVNGSSSKPARTRKSGGFLLESAFQQTRPSRTLLSRSRKEPADPKGKRKGDEPELMVPKRRLAGRQHLHSSSVGSSPLATEVSRAEDKEKSPVEIGSASRQSGPSSSSQAHSNEVEDDRKSRIPRQAHNNIGFDTDPAQIVNMALSLSEGRRRQVSGMRVPSGDIGGIRMVSAGHSPNLRNGAHGNSLGRYMNSQRQVSRNLSPKPDSALRIEVGTREQHGQRHASQRIHLGEADAARTDEDFIEDLYDVSPATFARVQKAKNHFDLFYEHRRLLSHLPPIRRPGTPYGNSTGQPQSRVYNPLQYARNRKLRFREKKPIPSESEGWHDIEQVRGWVDAVIISHNETRHDPEECVRLPELHHHKREEIIEEVEEEEKDPMALDSPASSSRRPSDNPDLKPRRPRSDWVIYPGDLIADAFWLEQGLNKTRIEDREGNKIYPPDTQFKFSGWRNHTPVHVPSPMQGPTPPPEQPRGQPSAPSTSPLPELPNFTSAARDRKHSRRGRRRGKFRESLISTQNSDSGSRSRQHNKKNQFLLSSSSEDSEDEAIPRGRKRKASKRRVLEGLASTSNIFDKPATGRSNRYKDDTQEDSGQPTEGPVPPESKRPSVVEGLRLSKLLSKGSSKASSPHVESRRQSETARHSSEKARQPRLSHEGDRQPRSSYEYDSTAPSSPTASGFPSIAINLSPPPSRSPSPSKKPLQSRLNPFRDRSESKQRHGISTNDFAEDPFGRPPRDRSSETEKAGHESEHGSRGTSPMTREPSPMTKRNSLPIDPPRPLAELHRSSTVSKHSTKASSLHNDPSSRIKGMFKGGRIAELVGHEVSRVGDFIWKRDPPPPHHSRTSSAASSFQSAHASDHEDETPNANGHVPKTPVRTHSQRFSSPTSDGVGSAKPSPSQSGSSPSSNERPQYHISNLPSFTSPFQRDREQQDDRQRALLAPSSAPPNHEPDHISRLAADHRSHSRSPRLDRLAPPKLVTSRPSSPTPSFSGARRNSYGFGRDIDLTGSANASQVFNEAIESQPRDAPVTGLAGLKASSSGVGLSRDWNVSNRSLAEADVDSIVTRRDIARAAALLKSSAVKAREISRRAHAVGKARKFVLDTIEPSNPTLHQPGRLLVTKKEEHVVAARNLISSLTSQSAAFRDHLRVFSTETCPGLHTELQALDDMMDNTLTPRVRVAADEAGELSMKLTTTSTLAVKGLNDVISGALRRRRRGPVRWMRRFGYVLIEWTVVALLWAIWLVVTMIRILLGTFRGAYHGVKWLLWF